MANSNSQRVAAFLLAVLFLLTTIGTAIYVIVQLNTESGIVNESTSQTEPEQTDEESCGSGTLAPVDPRPVPSVTTADVPVTELQKIDVKVGDGEEVQPGDCVAVLYYGTLASNGEKFDGNYETGEPIELSLAGVIQGWTDGIPGMKVGGVRRLVIPAAQAYGDQASGSIPANSDLVFEVEIFATRRAQ